VGHPHNIVGRSSTVTQEATRTWYGAAATSSSHCRGRPVRCTSTSSAGSAATSAPTTVYAKVRAPT
jgi:hypothetical protein